MYSLNGGSGNLPVQAALPPRSTFKLSSGSGLSRSGYKLTGWSDGETFYSLGGVYTVGTDLLTVTFTAQWMRVYTITYNSGGGVGTVPTQVSYQIGYPFTVSTGDGLSRTGYKFKGWNDGTKSYLESETYIVGKTNITLTAEWVQMYTIKYDLNSGIGNTPPPVTVKASEIITLPSMDGITNSSGATFRGWWNGTTLYEDTYTVSTNKTLIAYWSAYKVKCVLSVTVNSGGTFTIPGSTGLTAPSGQTFYGWSNGTNTYRQNEQITVNSNVTFTAQWGYTVVFRLYENDTETAVFLVGQSVTFPNMTSYETFNFWTDANNVRLTLPYSMPSRSVHLYATFR
jgi:uncharacterized repeat protein (TIGR02543 family)